MPSVAKPSAPGNITIQWLRLFARQLPHILSVGRYVERRGSAISPAAAGLIRAIEASISSARLPVADRCARVVATIQDLRLEQGYVRLLGPLPQAEIARLPRR